MPGLKVNPRTLTIALLSQKPHPITFGGLGKLRPRGGKYLGMDSKHLSCGGPGQGGHRL